MTTIIDNKNSACGSSSSHHKSIFNSGKRRLGRNQSNLSKILASRNRTVSESNIRIDTSQSEVIIPAKPGSSFDLNFPPVYDDQGKIIS